MPNRDPLFRSPAGTQIGGGFRAAQGPFDRGHRGQNRPAPRHVAGNGSLRSPIPPEAQAPGRRGRCAAGRVFQPAGGVLAFMTVATPAFRRSLIGSVQLKRSLPIAATGRLILLLAQTVAR